MSTFIKVIEIWTPTADGKGLAVHDALYGDYAELKHVSENRIFNYGEGLPGIAWEKGAPQLITDLENSYFLRKEEAKRAGLKAAIALPIFAGEFLIAVVLLFCRDTDKQGENLTGAIELWSSQGKQSNLLKLQNAYYVSSLSKLKNSSVDMQFAKGSGLPGSVWDYRIPMVVDNMLDSSLFHRASTAAVAGITSVIGLPLSYFNGNEYVLTFLSANKTPIASRFEIWVPNREREYLFFHAGSCEQEKDLRGLHKGTHIHRDQGLLGKVWLSGIPAISKDLVNDKLMSKKTKPVLSCGLVLPIIEDAFLKSLMVFLF